MDVSKLCRRLAGLSVALVTSPVAVASAPVLECRTGRPPTVAESALLAEINLARTNPAIYAAVLVQQLTSYRSDGTIDWHGRRRLMREGRAALDEAVVALRAQVPLAPLQMSSCLSDAAVDHVVDTGPKGIYGHRGSDGSMPSDRANRRVVGAALCGENISYAMENPRDIVGQLLVDDGVPSRGHRANLLNGDYRFTGVASGPHARFGTVADVLLCLNDVHDASMNAVP